MKKSYWIGLSILLVAAGVVFGALAGSTIATEAHNVLDHGNAWVTLAKNVHVQRADTDLRLEDSNGQPIQPLLYNGSLYLPVEAVGDALSIYTHWEPSTQTLSLGAVTPAGHVSTVKGVNLKSPLSAITDPWLIITSNTESQTAAFAIARDSDAVTVNVDEGQEKISLLLVNHNEKQGVNISIVDPDTGYHFDDVELGAGQTQWWKIIPGGCRHLTFSSTLIEEEK